MLSSLNCFFDDQRCSESYFDSNRVCGCEALTVVSELRSVKEPMEFTAYVRKEGKITVPKEVRDALGLERGDLIRCKVVKVRVNE